MAHTTTEAFDAHAAHAAHGHDDHHHQISFVQRWLFSTNHKDIGTLYIIFSIITACIGAAASVWMRANLSHPGSELVHAGQAWNVLITAHGLIMVFFAVMPATMGGFGNWFVPLMIGAPDMAFPRLNNLSFWLLVAGFCMAIISMFVDG